MHANISVDAQGFADAFFHSERHFLCITQILQVPTLAYIFLILSTCLLATAVIQKIYKIIKSV